MDSALAVLREHAHGNATTQAGLVRKAVFDGVALDAILRAASAHPSGDEAGQRVARDLRALLQTLTLPDAVKAGVLDELDRVSRDLGVQERRRRQRALLRAPNPHGDAAADLKETFDAFERQPV